MEFRPKLLSVIIESGTVAPISAAVGFAYGRWVNGNIEAGVMIASGMPALVVIFYPARFLWQAPKLVELTDEEIVLHYRRGSRVTKKWSAIDSAVHESKTGLRWNLKTNDGELIIRDDGFNTEQWDLFSKTMTQYLQTHEIEHRATGLASVFADDDEDEETE